jgi:hypothetical protein
MYVRAQAMAAVSLLTEALESLITQAEAISKNHDEGDEERAFLELLEPTGDLVRRVPEWLDLADEGECTWLAFLELHPELERLPPPD